MRSMLMMAAFATVLVADEPKKKEGTVTPKTAPLKASLVTKETKFVLDRGGKTADEYEKMLDDAAKPEARGPAPKAISVDFTLVVTNTSDKTISLWKNGDPVTIEFSLTGPGVKALEPRIAMTQEFRIPQSVEIEAGKTLEIPLKSLSGGMRGVSKLWFWTKPGEYKIAASLKTGVSPAPEGAKKSDDFGLVTVTTAPIAVTVAEKPAP